MEIRTKLIKGFAALLTIALLFVVLPVVEAKPQATLYVDDNFDPSTPGWGTTHFSSILEAINAASAGDIIEVADGTYGPSTTETDDPGTEGLFTIDKPLTIKAADGSRPIIDGSGVNGIFKIWHSGAAFSGGEVVIEGFDLTGDSTTGIAITAAMCATADTTKIIIKDNLFHGMIGGFHPWGSGSFCTDPGQEARVENVEVIGNEFYDLGAAGAQGGFGVYIEGLSDWAAAGNQFAVKIDDNLFKDIIDVPGTDGGAGIGIKSPDAGNNEAANAQIVNNTFEDTVNVGVGILAGDVTDTEIMYNSFAASTVGVYNNEAGTVDATRNWWADAAGPVASQYVGNVDYTPWYATETTTPTTENVSVERSGTVVAYSDTIQGAIDAASDGDTINVNPGTYVESLMITKDLTLLGGGTGNTIIQSPDTLPVCVSTSKDNKAIVCIEDSVVTMDGFTIDGLGKGNANYRFIGVGFHNAGGTLQNSEVLNIKDTPFSGAQHGIGIYSYNEDGTLYTINLLDNYITDFQKNAIALNASDTTPLDVVVSRNAIVGAGPTSVTAQNGIQVWAMLGTGVISDNTVEGIYYTSTDCSWVGTSILNYYADVDVTGNTITGAQEAIYPYLGSGDITGNTITVTRQDACYSDAIYAYHPKADMEISNNVVTYDANGLTGYDSYGIAVSVGDNDLTFTANNNQVNNFDYGIDLYRSSSALGDLTTITLQSNDLHTSLADLWLEGTLQADPIIEKNKLLGDAAGIQNDLTKTINASPNWWGSIAGPVTGQVVGDVEFKPWCGDEDCTFTVPDGNGVIELSGTINVPGGIIVDQSGLTFLLKDGTVIQNDSPCFEINADNTKVTYQSLGGATCVPTGGSNGIDVADGLTNIIIEGIEIDGSGQDTGDGIHFAGAITDVILRDNFIHDLDGDGVEFTAAPAGTAQVQGNLFMVNAGVGVEAPADLDVTYNAWGDVGGPASGDGVSANITSYDPWTHVDLYLESSGTDVANEVREGETITYTIYANLKNATGADFVLAFDPALLEVSGTTLGSVFDAPATGGDVVTYDNVTGEIHFAGQPDPFAEQSGNDLMLFTVTFTAKADGVSALAFGDDEFAMSPPSGPSNNIYAAALEDGLVTVRNHYTVMGTVSMQGRTVRSGVLFKLTSNTGILWGPFQGTSTDPISNNVSIASVVENEYQITIEQDRYLDVVVASGKLVDVDANVNLNELELFGGDVVDDEVIDVADASLIGANYYATGDNQADANYDGIVNIFDLALVGGNYGLESATAYGGWTPK